MAYRRGDIYWCDLNPARGHEQKNLRPILIVQNNIGNTYSPTTIGVVFTKEFCEKDKKIPTNIFIEKDNINNLKEDSLLETSQIRVFDAKTRLKRKLGELNKTYMLKVDKALKVSLMLIEVCPKCGYMFIRESEKCPKCNLKIKNICSSCNILLDSSWKFCPFCGKEV